MERGLKGIKGPVIKSFCSLSPFFKNGLTLPRTEKKKTKKKKLPLEKTKVKVPKNKHVQDGPNRVTDTVSQGGTNSREIY